jgi:tetratricopeptide (TPR) repeat protein
LISDVARLDSLLKATTVNSDTLANQLRDQISTLKNEVEISRQGQQAAENRAKILNDEKILLTSKLESVKMTSVSPKKIADSESKISALERELSSMKRAFGKPKKESDDDLTSSLTGHVSEEDEDDGVTPSPDLPLTENVLKAENMFHDAVDLCAEGSFAEAVALLEQASAILARLPKSEISKNDPTTLKILESDIYGQLGVAFQSLSQVAEAIEAYMTAVDVDPEAHACHANLAVLLHHQSRLKEAETHAKIAIELAPDIDEYQTLLSQIKTFTPTPAGPANHKFRASTNW